MEGVLDLYDERYDPARPVVGFDESPQQLIPEVRAPIAVQPDAPANSTWSINATGCAIGS
jgi:hypothetical protein